MKEFFAAPFPGSPRSGWNHQITATIKPDGKAVVVWNLRQIGEAAGWKSRNPNYAVTRVKERPGFPIRNKFKCSTTEGTKREFV